MPDAVQTAIYKLAYDTANFEAGQKVIASGNEQTIGSFERLEAKLDANVRIEQRRLAQIEQINRVAEEEGISQTRRAVAIDLANQKFEQMALKAAMAASAEQNLNAALLGTTPSLDRIVTGMSNFNSSSQMMIAGMSQAGTAAATVTAISGRMNAGFIANRGSLMSLQAAGINAFQALAAGMSVSRVAMMEGGQVIGALAQSISGTLGIAIAAGIAGVALLVMNMDKLGVTTNIVGDATDDYTKAIEANNKVLETAAERSDRLAAADLFLAQTRTEAAIKTNELAAAELARAQADALARGRGPRGIGQGVTPLEAIDAQIIATQHNLDRLRSDLEKLNDPSQFGKAREAAEKAGKEALKDREQEIKAFDAMIERLSVRFLKAQERMREERRKGQEAIEDQIAAIEAETAMLGLSDEERAVAVELLRQEEIARRHETTATDAQRAALIRVTVAQIEAERAAEAEREMIEQLTDQMDAFAKSAADAAFNGGEWKDAWLDAIMSVFDLLENQLKKLETLGGPGGGIFGSGGIFDLSKLFNNIFGGGIGPVPGQIGTIPGIMAEGGEGIVTKPTLFIAGEAGPERFRFEPVARPGRATMSGESITVSNVFDFRGAMVDEAKIRREILKATPTIVDQSVAAVTTRRQRGGRGWED